MSIPKGQLCYLTPEIMRTVRVQATEGKDLSFTKASVVYPFGTVWFELLTREWSWKHQSPETIIWMVGKGMKPSLANLSASRDVKEILVMCWTFKNEHRPDFTYLSNSLETIPKKRLARSPSHPVHLTRSAESTFQILFGPIRSELDLFRSCGRGRANRWCHAQDRPVGL